MDKQGKKKQGALAWLLEQGVGAAYTVLLSMSIAITKWLIIAVLFAAAWWERIR